MYLSTGMSSVLRDEDSNAEMLAWALDFDTSAGIMSLHHDPFQCRSVNLNWSGQVTFQIEDTQLDWAHRLSIITPILSSQPNKLDLAFIRLRPTSPLSWSLLSGPDN